MEPDFERLERAKRKLRLLQSVLTAYVEGETSTRQLGQRLGVSHQTVWRLQVFLGVETGKAWRGGAEKGGRLDSRKALKGVTQ